MKATETQETIFKLLLQERYNQELKFGEIGKIRRLHPLEWNAIVNEESGEVARGVLENDAANLRNELIQLAAVCVAALEDDGWQDTLPDLTTLVERDSHDRLA